jgi:hypothetical protein
VQYAKRFFEQFASIIVATLGCADRVIFKGHLFLGNDAMLNRFVDPLMKRKDFIPLVQQMSEQLVEFAKQLAADADAPYEFLQGHHRKEALVDQIDNERKQPPGLIAVLCCMETCRTVKLRYAKSRPELTFSHRPQRVLYYYFNDEEFGRMYVRIQTWFPFTVQIYLNGHNWLQRELLKHRIGFVQEDNCFTQIDEPARVQQLANRFPHMAWVHRLNDWIRAVHPLLKHDLLRGLKYRWYIDQFEYSTDVIFASDKLTSLYERLLDYAAVSFSAQDILKFLGRRLHGRFDGEVITQCKKDRWPGARIKHRMKNNWIKMYDKFGKVLRIETVINQPQEFKVRRRRTRHGRQTMIWCPMNKGVANLYQYFRKAATANQRYLGALSPVGDPAPSYKLVETLVQPCRVGKRSYAGFNPADRETVTLFAAVLRPEHLLHGFRTGNLRQIIYGRQDCPQERGRKANSISRKLKRLHLRSLIAKIPHTHRWQVTERGRTLLSQVVQLYHHGLATAA